MLICLGQPGVVKLFYLMGRCTMVAVRFLPTIMVILTSMHSIMSAMNGLCCLLLHRMFGLPWQFTETS